MDNCSETCSNTCSWTPSGTTRMTPEMAEVAQALACLLVDHQAFQNFIRLARTVHLDDEVNDIVSRINGYGFEDNSDDDDVQALEDRLEALPVMRGYRQAEDATRLVFSAVEEAISQAAGVPFAENARPKACG